MKVIRRGGCKMLSGNDTMISVENSFARKDLKASSRFFAWFRDVYDPQKSGKHAETCNSSRNYCLHIFPDDESSQFASPRVRK